MGRLSILYQYTWYFSDESETSNLIKNWKKGKEVEWFQNKNLSRVLWEEVYLWTIWRWMPKGGNSSIINHVFTSLETPTKSKSEIPFYFMQYGDELMRRTVSPPNLWGNDSLLYCLLNGKELTVYPASTHAICDCPASKLTKVPNLGNDITWQRKDKRTKIFLLMDYIFKIRQC